MNRQHPGQEKKNTILNFHFFQGKFYARSAAFFDNKIIFRLKPQGREERYGYFTQIDKTAYENFSALLQK
ncbi:hypothetical protein MR798_04120 [bacterium]|nr:hypothetical protein [bacterium]